MQLLRYIVRPLSPWGTPLRSDTLCGLLLWRLAERYGSAACRAAIAAFRAGEPPFVLSSALTLGMVSSPCLPPAPRALFRQWVNTGEFRDAGGKAISLFEALQAYKRFRKTAHLPVEVWARHAPSLSLRPLLAWFCQWSAKKDSPKTGESVEPHVSIDRRSATAAEGGLFFNRLTWIAEGAPFHLYARAADPTALLELLREAGGLAAQAHTETGDLGFGKDASTGKGRFAVEPDNAFDPAPLENDGPHAMLCSVCASMDMSCVDGWYSVATKRGKAGPGLASPHKAPMLLLQEGSVLRRLPAGPYLLEGIHADPAIVQVTPPLTLPCRIAEEASHV